MENTKQKLSSMPMVTKKMKAIKVLVADALQEYCYINDAENYAKYNFERISATFEAIRTLNADAMSLLESDGISIK